MSRPIKTFKPLWKEKGVMRQPIVGFHQDDVGDWVADLACGHTQHVRHQPPWMNRPWVITAAGRRRYLGQCLRCKRCEQPEHENDLRQKVVDRKHPAFE